MFPSKKMVMEPGSIKNQTKLKNTLSQVSQLRGGTETGDAIDKMRTYMFSDKFRRPNVPHIGIVITDGESTHPRETQKAAKLAKKDGITMFAIGVGL